MFARGERGRMWNEPGDAFFKIAVLVIRHSRHCERGGEVFSPLPSPPFRSEERGAEITPDSPFAAPRLARKRPGTVMISLHRRGWGTGPNQSALTPTGLPKKRARLIDVPNSGPALMRIGSTGAPGLTSLGGPPCGPAIRENETRVTN